MFGFIERRVLKEHMKLVAQNYSALSYLSAFLPPHVGQRYSEIIADVQGNWEPGTKLSDQQFTALWEINKLLRRAYDASPAKSLGMKHFDKQFQPMLGWEEYYSQYL